MGEVNTGGQGAAPGKGMGIAAIIMGAITCNPLALGLGIGGIVMIGQYATKLAAGDQTGAASSAKTGKTLSLVGLILGILSVVGSIIYLIVMLASGGLEALF